jgi:hypothetical protein
LPKYREGLRESNADRSKPIVSSCWKKFLFCFAAAQAIEWMSRVRSIDPHSVQLMSQAAIVHTLANRPEEALKDLREAFQNGYSIEEARREPEFRSLQSRPEFASLLTEFSTKK